MFSLSPSLTFPLPGLVASLRDHAQTLVVVVVACPVVIVVVASCKSTFFVLRPDERDK